MPKTATLVLLSGLFLVFAAGAASGASEEMPAFKPAPGDTNCNSVIEVVDALISLREAARLPRAGACLAAADVNCDGVLDLVDVLGVLRHLAALPALPAPPGCPPTGLLRGCGDAALPQRGTYIALGDSLSVGVGSTDPANKAFVPLVHDCLGSGFQLMNLGHAGDTSRDLIRHGHLQTAIETIAERNHDGDPDNDVRLVTLLIGGNDLLALFFTLVLPGTCPDLETALEKPQCIDALVNALNNFRTNLEEAVTALRDSDPQVPIVLMTIYDPFSGVNETISGLARIALEGVPDTPVPEGLNVMVRRQAYGSDVYLADIYPLFLEKGDDYIASDLIHANDAGYRVMADTVLGAIGISRAE
jgi:lysophospholipase L1-like esterase